jgi:hypothetical protein
MITMASTLPFLVLVGVLSAGAAGLSAVAAVVGRMRERPGDEGPVLQA